MAEEKYENLLDEDGTPIEISLYEVEKELSILAKIDECTANLDSIKAEIARVQEQISRATVIASKSGFINLISAPVVGNIIGSGNLVATIIPAEESEYKVLMYVNNAGIANIGEGDIVKYSIAALPYNSYGIVEGNVLSISNDTIMQNGEFSGYYLIEGSIANESLYDAEGHEGEIGIGMEVTARIVTDRKTIARYLLEKIDLF